MRGRLRRPRSAMPREAGGPPRARLRRRRSTAPAPATRTESAPRASSRQLLAPKRPRTVVAVHRPLHACVERHLQRARDTFDDAGKPFGLGFGEPPEDVLAARLGSLARRLSNSDAEADEGWRPQRADEG